MSKLTTGQNAPDFCLLDNQQKQHCLLDYRGQWLILFFYPKDNTPGCTIEACQLRDNYSEVSALNCQILGINTDSSESHDNFINQQQLPFALLSDADRQTCDRYNALFKLGPIKFAKRHSFIIDPNGQIAKIYRKVKPTQHSRQLITDLKALQSAHPL